MAHFLALPLVAKVTGLLIAAALFVLAWLKRKAIAAALGAATQAVESKLLGWFGKKLYAAAPPPTIATTPQNERTYRGTFVVYGKLPNYRQAYIFTIEHEYGGITSTVPVTSTHLFPNVRRGDFVEIDTQVGPYIGEEVVLRVRTVERRKV